MESDCRLFEDLSPGKASVCGYLHVPANAPNDGLVITHGAGANCKSPLLVAIADAFCRSGVTVLCCDLPFRQLRPHGPPPRGSAGRDQEGLRGAVEALRKQVPGRVFLGGHSYGGRQSSILAASEPRLADALLLLSYPLHPPKTATKLRAAHFPDLRTTVLFVHGTRDPFGSIDEMKTVLQLIPSPTRLLVVDGAGHELLTARNRSTLPDEIVSAFATFIAAPK
jgi:predicted alpha/beta-hydrolase family hydrolase